MSELSAESVPKTGLIIAILVLASSTSIMSTDMYTPSLPDLAIEFDTSASMVELTISLNFLAFGLAQFFHGPLSDRFGRRPVLMVSLLCVALLSLMCTVATSVEQLIATRILLGLAAAAEAVIGLAIIKDLYNEKQQIKLLAAFGMVIALVPAIAPIIGGFLHVRFGWQSNFYVISALAVFSVFVIALCLPESTTPDKQALLIKPLLRRYLGLLKNKNFLVHSLMLGIALGIVYVFVTTAPIVLIGSYGVAPDHFGFYQGMLVGCFFIGSMVAGKMIDYWSSERLMIVGCALAVSGVALLLLLYLVTNFTAVSFTLCFCLIAFGISSVFAVAPSRALSSVVGNTGTSSAMLSGLEQVLAALAALVVSLLNNGTEGPIVLVTSVLAIILMLLMRQSMQLRAI